jgi:hypothetical protein
VAQTIAGEHSSTPAPQNFVRRNAAERKIYLHKSFRDLFTSPQKQSEMRKAWRDIERRGGAYAFNLSGLDPTFARGVVAGYQIMLDTIPELPPYDQLEVIAQRKKSNFYDCAAVVMPTTKGRPSIQFFGITPEEEAGYLMQTEWRHRLPDRFQNPPMLPVHQVRLDHIAPFLTDEEYEHRAAMYSELALRNAIRGMDRKLFWAIVQYFGDEFQDRMQELLFVDGLGIGVHEPVHVAELFLERAAEFGEDHRQLLQYLRESIAMHAHPDWDGFFPEFYADVRKKLWWEYDLTTPLFSATSIINGSEALAWAAQGHLTRLSKHSGGRRTVERLVEIFGEDGVIAEVKRSRRHRRIQANNGAIPTLPTPRIDESEVGGIPREVRRMHPPPLKQVDLGGYIGIQGQCTWAEVPVSTDHTIYVETESGHRYRVEYFPDPDWERHVFGSISPSYRNNRISKTFERLEAGLVKHRARILDVNATVDAHRPVYVFERAEHLWILPSRPFQVWKLPETDVAGEATNELMGIEQMVPDVVDQLGSKKYDLIETAIASANTNHPRKPTPKPPLTPLAAEIERDLFLALVPRQDSMTSRNSKGIRFELNQDGRRIWLPTGAHGVDSYYTDFEVDLESGKKLKLEGTRWLIDLAKTGAKPAGQKSGRQLNACLALTNADIQGIDPDVPGRLEVGEAITITSLSPCVQVTDTVAAVRARINPPITPETLVSFDTAFIRTRSLHVELVL